MKKLPVLVALAMLLVACQQGNPAEPPVPPGPSALTGRIVGGNSAQLSWTPCPDTDFLRYRLYRSNEAGVQQHSDEATILLSTENVNNRSFVDQELQAGHWYYAVQTEDNDHLTSWSNEVHLQVTARSK